jgi:hypothetical protein
VTLAAGVAPCARCCRFERSLSQFELLLADVDGALERQGKLPIRAVLSVLAVGNPRGAEGHRWGAQYVVLPALASVR